MALLHALTTLLLLQTAHAKSSYAELIEEDIAGITVLEKNARTFLRQIEHRLERRLTQEEMRSRYASRIDMLRKLEKQPGKEQVNAIREWVKAVVPVMNEIGIYSGRLEEHGPLHIVMHSANELLGREHAEEDHPYVVAKAIIPDIRRFTEAIIRCAYYLPIKLSRTPPCVSVALLPLSPRARSRITLCFDRFPHARAGGEDGALGDRRRHARAVYCQKMMEALSCALHL